MIRKRKWIALLAAAALAAVSVAAAAEDAARPAEAAQSEWREGMSASKPYAGVPEVDLSEKLGYMIFYPAEKRAAENSCKNLYIYLPRTDVKAGAGKLYLCTEEEGEIWRTAMNDEEAVTRRELTKAERVSLMWGEGTCFEVTLPRSLELGKRYFVNLERRGIETEDGKLENPAIGGTDKWTFTVEGEYGVSGMEYRRALSVKEPEPTETLEEEGTPAEAQEPAKPIVEYSEPLLKPEEGDEIRFDLQLGGEATMAVVYGYNGSVDFSQVMYEESCEATGKVLTENPAWGVMFLDAEGNELNRAEFR